MQLKVKTVLNAVQHFPGFVFHDIRLLDERNGQPRLEVTIVPHAGRPARCSHCRQPAPGYDHLPPRAPNGSIPNGSTASDAAAPTQPGQEGPKSRSLAGPESRTRAVSELGKRTAPKRSGLPDEAREWITACLRADQAPTGPDVGRRYRVDASTGRRWVRQVREALPSE